MTDRCRPNNLIVSVVIGSYNRRKFLKPAIESVRAELAELPHEIIVVDGGSDDGTLGWLVQQKDILTIVQHNRGKWLGKEIERKSWGYFMNLGFKAAKGKYICMLSDDCLVIPGAIKNGIKLFEREFKGGKKIGAVAFYWRNWPGQKDYWIGKTFGNAVFVNHGLYLKSALEEVGYVDGKSYQFYHADGDLCLRMAEKGYTCIDSPKSFIEHYSRANLKVRKSNLSAQKKDWETYQKKWGKLGVPEKGWVTKEFSDPANTAEKYWGRLSWFKNLEKHHDSSQVHALKKLLKKLLCLTKA